MGRTLNQKFILVTLAILGLLGVVAGLGILGILDLRNQALDLIGDIHQSELYARFHTDLVRAAGEGATYLETGQPGYRVEAESALLNAQQTLDDLGQDVQARLLGAEKTQNAAFLQREAAMR